MFKLIIGTLLFFSANASNCTPLPIGYSIPEEKIVQDIPEKDRDFAFITPYDTNTYIYDAESDYYEDYKRSYFAITKKKGGWDCLRHYEILANGSIPYFVNLSKCDENTLYFFPKDLILEAMNLEGVSYPFIDHSRFNKQKYYELLNKLLEHTRQFLTTRQMAAYLLRSLHYQGKGKILVLSQDTQPEYLRDLTLVGLKENLCDRVVDVPKIEHIYHTYDHEILNLYGKGMTYTKILDDLAIDRENLEARIQNREFDLVIYAELHKGALPYYDLVKSHYGEEEIAYLYCEERSGEFCSLIRSFHPPNLFIREYALYRNTYQMIDSLPDLLIDPRSEMARYAFAPQNRYQQSLVKRFYSLLQESGEKRFTVIDVGAQVGYFTLLAKYFPDSQWHAFEPIQEAAEILNRNLRLNEIKNVNVHAMAVSDVRGTAKLKMPPENSWGLATLGSNPHFAVIEEKDVPCIDLDSFAVTNHLEKVHFMKLDVEGWELRILQGAKNLILRDHPLILMEYSEAHMQQCNINKHELDCFLIECGYRWIRISDEDILCLPLERLGPENSGL